MTHPLQSWENPFINNNKNYSLGMFIVSASSMISECCATTGIDWLAVDIEASPATRHDLLHIAQSVNGSSVTLFARVAQNNQQYIEAALDVGVHGVIVPKVSTVEETKNVVSACYYPPMGTRGLNPIRCSAYFNAHQRYADMANSVSCIIQIETKQAIENLEEIAMVKGIDGLFIGCGDLAASLGIAGQFEHPEFHAAIEKVLAIAEKNNLIPGIFAYSNDLAKKYLGMGFKMIGIGNEIKFLRVGIENSILDIHN